MNSDYLQTPLGLLRISEEGGKITEITRVRSKKKAASSAAIKKCKQELEKFFAGKQPKLSHLSFVEGTQFQSEVWQALREIPYGETRSYGEIAKAIGRPKASRAVGAACGANPCMILTPCHRVLGSNGSLTGFAGGLSMKEKLLDLESQ